MTPQELAELSQQCGKLYNEGRWQEACTLAERLLALVRQHLGKNHPYYAHSLNNLAGLYRLVGRNQEAERVLQELLPIQSQTLKEEDLEYVVRLNNQAEHYRTQGKYNEAEQLFHQALEVGSRTLGKTHPHYIQCKTNLALVNHARGRYGQAEQILLEVLESWRQTRGQNSLDSAPALHNLAGTYHAMGNFQEAIDVQQQALRIWRRELGEAHPYVIVCLQSLANYYQELDNYEEAEILLQQVIKAQRQVLGDRHPNLAKNLNDLGLLQHSKGNYAAAESLYYQAIDISRQVWGENHKEFAVSLNNIAILYREMGKYEEAIPICQKATEILSQLLGQNHPDFATSLHNLASLHKSMGRYDEAKSLHLQALKIRRQALSADHPDIAGSLNSLGDLHQLINNYEDAIKFFLEAANIYQSSLGEEHTNFAESLNNIALMCKQLGKYDIAEHYYTEAINIYNRVLGKNNPPSAIMLGNLGDLYITMGDYVAAELRLQWAVKTRRTVHGENHPNFAFSLHNLAAYYQIVGNYIAAEPRYRESLKILRHSAGENHPNVAVILNHLAKLCAATDRELEALDLMQQQVAIDNRIMGQVFSISCDRQRFSYLVNIQANIGDYLSLILQHFPNSPENVGRALELVWQRKGIGAEALVAQRDAVVSQRYSKDSQLKQKLRELTTWRMQIAQKMLAGPGKDEELEAYERLLTEWIEHKEQLELELAQRIPEIRLEHQLRDANCHAVAFALPEKSTLVEFVRFRVYDFTAIPAENQPEWKAARYLAFVLQAREPENVQMIDLGEADLIDNMLTQFKAVITGKAESRDLDLGEMEFPHEDSEGNAVSLRKTIFDPLLKAVGDRKRLFLAPDGNFNQLPFEVLPLDSDRRVIDEYCISYLSTGRDLLRFQAKSIRRPNQPLVVADPDFNLSDRKSTRAFEKTKLTGHQSRDLERSQLSFRRLEGTRVEGRNIASLLGVKPLLGEEALEGRLKACHSPKVLHLATHGFFLKDQDHESSSELIGRVDRLSSTRLENPLLRSGLALAGANIWLNHGMLSPEAEDGILTAEDVAGLDLLDTELVVLSACETGLGAVQTGEGVFGLRRAFALAGAKTLVMSLWKVPDKETQELMTDFYSRALKGQPCAEALRDAQLAMKRKYPDPLYWGAFICQGNHAVRVTVNFL